MARPATVIAQGPEARRGSGRGAGRAAGPFRMLDWKPRLRYGRLGYIDSEIVRYGFHISHNW